MPHVKKNLLLAAVLSTGLGACVSTPNTERSATEDKLTSSSPSAKVEAASGSATSESDRKVAKAMAFAVLRDYLNDDRSSIALVEMRALNWPDASLGCPRPGLNYPQVIIPGYQAQLESGGERYNVHIAKQRAFVCDKNMKTLASKPNKSQKSGDVIAERIINLAKKDLATKLGVAEQNIQVLSSKPVTWPDARLGCEDGAVTNPGGGKPKARGVDGYRIMLANKGRQFVYHSDDDSRVFACPKIENF